MADILALLGDTRTLERRPPFLVEEADGAGAAAYRRLREDVFVTEQGLFRGSDADDLDADRRTIVLVARDRAGEVVGGVRLAPAAAPDIGWWTGSRLAVHRAARGLGAVGPALVRAACARAEAEGALRFDATVQPGRERLFRWLGWEVVGPVTVAGRPHTLVRWPIGRLQVLAAAAKGAIAPALDGLRPGGDGWVGDDGVPVPGTDVVATTDGIVPSMIERDPAWAGWCAVLVTVNDLAAMGAVPVGLLDAVGGRTASQVNRVMAGLRHASLAYGVPVLGGHTQVGVPPSLAATALGRTDRPVPGGRGRPGDTVAVAADLGGGWRPGHTGTQWDSTTVRRREELSAMLGAVARARPAAAKDVSMAGLAGTLAMLAEASGCGAELDVAAVPRPAAATVGDWFSCFPGFAMVMAGPPGFAPPAAGPAVSASCGRLVAGAGVSLVWPDGERTPAVAGPVTGLGPA